MMTIDINDEIPFFFLKLLNTFPTTKGHALITPLLVLSVSSRVPITNVAVPTVGLRLTSVESSS